MPVPPQRSTTPLGKASSLRSMGGVWNAACAGGGEADEPGPLTRSGRRHRLWHSGTGADGLPPAGRSRQSAGCVGSRPTFYRVPAEGTSLPLQGANLLYS